MYCFSWITISSRRWFSCVPMSRRHFYILYLGTEQTTSHYPCYLICYSSCFLTTTSKHIYINSHNASRHATVYGPYRYRWWDLPCDRTWDYRNPVMYSKNTLRHLPEPDKYALWHFTQTKFIIMMTSWCGNGFRITDIGITVISVNKLLNNRWFDFVHLNAEKLLASK